MKFNALYLKENKDGQNVEDFLERTWHLPHCTENEINRILSPQNAKDFLLKKRADIVADNPRFYRVYLALANQKSYVSFEKTFKTQHYEAFISKLSSTDKSKCEDIAYGDIYANDFNGYAARDKVWGDIIYLNTSLNYFITFINLALLNFKLQVPDKIRINSLRIAIRIAFQNEAMDFSLDQRGIIPKKIYDKINKISQNQMQYLAGHEFSHFLCGHLKDKKLVRALTFSFGNNQYFDRVYNNSQLEEFEADINSLTRPKYSKKEFEELIRSALIWFISLDIVDYAVSIFAPRSYNSYLTHPSAKDRFDNIVKHFKNELPNKLNEIEVIKYRAEQFKRFLQEDISVNYDFYDMYGSAYLDEPNTKWRGKELIDRIDY